jgi:hypothetical protein
MVKRTPAVTVGCLVVLLISGVVTSAAAQGGADEVERVIKEFLVPFSNRNISEFIEYFADVRPRSSRRLQDRLDSPRDASRGKPPSRASSKPPTSASDPPLADAARSSSPLI